MNRARPSPAQSSAGIRRRSFVISSRWRSMTRSCTARWGGPPSSWRKSREWTKQRWKKSRRRWLLIYHPYSGSRGESKLTRWHGAVHRETLQGNRPPLARVLDDVDPPYQSVLPRNPHRRLRVGEILPARRERDDVDCGAADGIGAHVAGAVALPRMLHKLADQIRSRRAGAGDRGPNHLSGRRAGRVEPEAASVRYDAVVLRLAAPHREVVGAPLEQFAACGIGIAEHGVFHDLDEVRGEGADAIVGGRSAVENRSGILGLKVGRLECWKEQHHSNFPPVQHSNLHAPTAAGSATRRPIASAIIRTSRISCAN